MPVKRRVRNKQPIKEQKQMFLNNLAKNFNILTPALSATHISYQTYAKWFKEDEKFRNDCLDVDNMSCDYVESKLMELIHSGDKVAIIYYLKCRRGEKWNDRSAQQLNISGQNIQFQIGSSDQTMSYEQPELIDMNENKLLGLKN